MSTQEPIRIRGACQHNLKNLDLDLPAGELIVITGVSGSGKSSLAFDTIYAEGQRRYVETFSAYARQFLERMERPRVDSIEGVPPAIAIDQVNPVRTSRSTVGTMTELADHLKLLFARAAQPYCSGCGQPVRRDTPESIAEDLLTPDALGASSTERDPDTLASVEAERRIAVTFAVEVPDSLSREQLLELLSSQGYTRIYAQEDNRIEVVQDRLRLDSSRRSRLLEALETALDKGRGHLRVWQLGADREPQGEPLRYSSHYHCAQCDRAYAQPTAELFSFNSPVGACDHCRGFGRIMEIDPDLVIPDPRLTLEQGAIKPFRGGFSVECQEDLLRAARRCGVPVDVPWQELTAEQRQWVWGGEDRRGRGGRWYGVQGYFDYLERKSYKMHVRVQLSRYRAYRLCPECQGARLIAQALDFRLGSRELADAVLEPQQRFRPKHMRVDEDTLRALPGLTLHDLATLPLGRLQRFFAELDLPPPLDQAGATVLAEIRARVGFLNQVGLGYLTLDRQSRTLSGGEAQRINLTTALGTSLVNTLFVLDEPSIGLHPRDVGRLIAILQQLRDAGNSLLVVEHGPQVMAAADRIIDMGPGPGERGGEVIFNGTPGQLYGADTLTAAYLTGASRVERLRQAAGAASASAPVAENNADATPPCAGPWLRVRGAAEHNLQEIDVAIPLQRLVCLTGVSGSGKSTLAEAVIYRGLLRQRGEAVETPGKCAAIEGAEQLASVALIDQSPIGKSARSCPVSYTGALEPIRKLFAKQRLAKERGYSAGTFSFNSGNGRCPSCKGSGFEHVEMQFLADVYLPCPDCAGRRFRAEVLEVEVVGAAGNAASIHAVLAMTVAEAVSFFAASQEVKRHLQPLLDVGLGYLRLGQPVPTLSGGEAQRLKLAGHLAEQQSRAKGRLKNSGKSQPEDEASAGTLFIFDEPTTGLHFADVQVLLQAFQRLLEAGNSLLIIEHNLDLIANADWLLELGPTGGEGGGQLLASATPQQLAAAADTDTGRALVEYLQSRDTGAILAPSTAEEGSAGWQIKETGHLSHSSVITIEQAREHNLNNIDLAIPRERFTVITGVSGSGKSTLAFDLLFAEGQRRYLESLNAYARQLVQPAARPDVGAINGIPPTVAIEQRTSRGGYRSSVATQTEIYHYLRLLYLRLGVQHCPECRVAISVQSAEAITAQLISAYRGETIELLAPLVVARKGIYKELAAWASSKGYSSLRVDGERLSTTAWPKLDRYREHDIDLPIGTIEVAVEREGQLAELLALALAHGNGVVRVLAPERDDGREQVFATARACPSCGRGFAEPDPRLLSYNSRHGWCGECKGTGLSVTDPDEASEEELERACPCPSCDGARLNPEARAISFHGYGIGEVTAWPVSRLREWLGALQLDGRGSAIGADVIAEINARLAFLEQVGLGYLTLDRAAPTLSGGEAQRIRLAASLGAGLQGVCYILDEPTIGLHARDNAMLLGALRELSDAGNTVVVVEHDEETIRAAEHLIDIGPGAGRYGGNVVAEGGVEDLIASEQSLTGRVLAKPPEHPSRPRRSAPAPGSLVIRGAKRHNLQDIDVDIPLGRLVCVTGVSGSGKSSLVREVVEPNVRAILGLKKGQQRPRPNGCRQLSGTESLKRVLEVDQTPIGRTPRSCPATYVGIWDAIRKLFAATEQARLRGWNAARFSFNTKGGRCEACSGQGTKTVEMSFLPDVKVPCESCAGTRFSEETRQVTYGGLSVDQVLALSIEQAREFFAAHSRLEHILGLLSDIGLGYLSLGQPSPTLSGGEAQRLKLVTELAKARPVDAGAARGRSAAPTLYLLDEPTVGLHIADVQRLTDMLHALVDGGHTVVVIEHNLDVIAEADHVIDLGPEGGSAGGRVVASGSPEQLAAATTPTGQALRSLRLAEGLS
ncbi:excinuclease ABC subunit A [Halorhodospira halochloris]|uniref:UvrABC system protein A n=1 Tax=Halorhodospira halochloris TaxID=1052 RepID=A0A0X8X7A8_HALHR|nr:excinuclease ABC subunit UvrA [Halorhodospira halochloris]MBK1650630.1 excinuclease ABC subunit A [Halorhodospira halochloris]BAU56886.1 excinuclease ABC subunit A [Halorhodospira halochloris]